MEAHGVTRNKVSTCLYIDRKVIETAKQAGLNISKVAENSLIDAIGRLTGTKPGTASRNQPSVSLEGRGRDLNPGTRLHRQGGQRDIEGLLSAFFDFCTVDMRLAINTAKGYRRHMRRFFKTVKKPARSVTAEDVREVLKPLVNGSANTYGNVLKPLKVFFRDFMKMPEAVESFKFSKAPLIPVTVPSKEKLRKFYQALRTPIARALFLMYASTGLRKMELLSLKKEDIDFDKRMIVPRSHSGETKRSWAAFFNEEAEQSLKEYLATRKDDSPKLFRISLHSFIDIWRYAAQDSSVTITPQVLREWFCDEMGRLGVPDRYVDAFCGRVPGSVLAKRYSDFGPEKLKQIYDKSGLRTQV
jgi:site-specific recombinase XerD